MKIFADSLDLVKNKNRGGGLKNNTPLCGRGPL